MPARSAPTTDSTADGRARVSFYTDWFLADPAEAEAVASIATTEEHSFEDWPHLALKDAADVPLTLLRGILGGQPGTALDVDGETLFWDEGEEGEGMVSVTQVLPAFVDELAALAPAQVKRAAAAWQRCEGMTDWAAADVVRCLRETVTFARRARRAGKAVLRLSTA
jgi:hypothetical protein